jgi:glutaredoxin-dependent peroxiredoxin
VHWPVSQGRRRRQLRPRLAAALAVLALALARGSCLWAQADSRQPPTPTARIVKGPETGQRAPDFTLPWASRDAIGPEDQPFRLTDNLGKVVVLAFFARDFTPGSIAELQGLAGVADSSGPEVVVVAVSSDSLETHRRFATSIGIKFLLLSDPDQRVARRYGSDGSDGVDRPTVYVIKPDGKVSYRDLGLEPQDKREYESLRRAVAKAAQP